jgi:hypothetical protein
VMHASAPHQRRDRLTARRDRQADSRPARHGFAGIGWFAPLLVAQRWLQFCSQAGEAERLRR